MSLSDNTVLLFIASPAKEAGAFHFNKVYITKLVVLGLWLKPMQTAQNPSVKTDGNVGLNLQKFIGIGFCFNQLLSGEDTSQGV